MFKSAYVASDPIPHQLIDLLTGPSEVTAQQLEEIYPVLGSSLTWENYAERFLVLLHMETVELKLLRGVRFEWQSHRSRVNAYLGR